VIAKLMLSVRKW